MDNLQDSSVYGDLVPVVGELYKTAPNGDRRKSGWYLWWYTGPDLYVKNGPWPAVGSDWSLWQ